MSPLELPRYPDTAPPPTPTPLSLAIRVVVGAFDVGAFLDQNAYVWMPLDVRDTVVLTLFFINYS